MLLLNDAGEPEEFSGKIAIKRRKHKTDKGQTHVSDLEKHHT